MSQMRGMQHCWTHPNWVRWWTQCHTSLPHSLLATPTKHNERPPRPSTIGYEDPPPWSRNGDNHPQMSMGAQHHHWQTATMAHWLRGPTTTIDKCPWTATRDHPHHWRMATRGDLSRGRPARYVAERVCISIPPGSPFHPCSDQWW